MVEVKTTGPLHVSKLSLAVCNGCLLPLRRNYGRGQDHRTTACLQSVVGGMRWLFAACKKNLLQDIISFVTHDFNEDFHKVEVNLIIFGGITGLRLWFLYLCHRECGNMDMFQHQPAYVTLLWIKLRVYGFNNELLIPVIEWNMTSFGINLCTVSNVR